MSRLIPSLLVAAAGAVALSGCAPTAPAASGPRAAAGPERQCMFQDQIQSFRVRSPDQTIFIRGSGKTVFQLETAGYCPDLDDAMGLAFLPQRGLDHLCTGDWTQVVPSGAMRPITPCRVRIVKRLTEAEVAALPERDRP